MKNSAGTAANRKRSAAKANGGTVSSAQRIGTKAKPQTVTTATTSSRSLGSEVDGAGQGIFQEVETWELTLPHCNSSRAGCAME